MADDDFDGLPMYVEEDQEEVERGEAEASAAEPPAAAAARHAGRIGEEGVQSSYGP